MRRRPRALEILACALFAGCVGAWPGCAPTRSNDEGRPCRTAAQCEDVCAAPGPCEQGDPAPPPSSRFCTLVNGAGCRGACIVEDDETLTPVGSCAD